MTDQEISLALEEMQTMFGELPNPDHEPIQFANFVTLYKYYKQKDLPLNQDQGIILL